MATDTSSKRPLTQLNHDIEEAEAELAKLEADRASVARMVSKASRRLRVLKLARWTRKPTVSLDLKPVVVLAVESGGTAILIFIVLLIVFGSFSLAFLGLLVGFATTAAVLAVLLFKPSDELLPATIAEAESHHQLLQARHKEKVERITETKTRLNRLLEERRDQIASGKLQKAALLQRKWKTMQPAEWQDFVVEICRTLGAKVERSGRPGDEDATLVADFGPRRVAILTAAKDHNVSSATIQSALAAQARLSCDACAVIINRRFTGAAQDFAERNGCTAVGTGEFPEFVMGKIEI
jgi:HJR/Mrr/RecB family endonuclease